MLNNSDKLENAVKQSLGNYEAAYNADDWSKMEGMLNAAPKSVSFKWSYVLNTFIVLAILTGGYLFYSMRSSKKDEPAKIPVVNTPAPTAPTSAPIPKPEPPVNAAVSVPPSTVDDKKEVEKEVKEPKAEEIVVKENDKKEPEVKEKKSDEAVAEVKEKKSKKDKENEKAKKKKDKAEKDSDNHPVVLKMGNEPVFGDMLDSTKGIVTQTKEKDKTKKAVQSQDYSIGWNNILKNVNPDSIKHHREKMKKDTVASPR